MKRKIILATIFSMFLAAAITAQTKTNFEGDWELDASKSKMDIPIDSMTLKVTQTEKEFTVESETKRAAGDSRGGGMGNGGMRGGNQTIVYNLEGKEVVSDIGGGAMTGKETRKATMTADGKLNLNSSRVFTGEMGGVTMKTNEIWEALDAGKTLKIIRYMETPRGARNSEMYFTRKTPVPATEVITSNSGEMNSISEGTSKKINGGVLNGKALLLPLPEYPAAARAVRATGAVNVQVTINEQGSVISASAVSGHPLLRQAAEDAARRATFTATRLEGNPVSVTGVLVYNFVP